MKYLILLLIITILFAYIIGKCNEDLDETQGARVKVVAPKDKTNNDINKKNKHDGTKELEVKDSIEIIFPHLFFHNFFPTIPASYSSILLHRTAYTASYNPDTRCPNWVAWRLTRERLEGNASRDGVPYYDDDGLAIGIGVLTNETARGGYIVDTEVESPRPELDDYKDAAQQYNLSHGHMCPAGDNKWSKEAMNQSFLLTNMCPQDAKLNNGAWNKLEEKCRTLARRYGELYIVTGPVFFNGVNRTIGTNHVAVPDAFFKVLLRGVEEPKSIGFVYPNDSGSYGWERCACSVDDVEKLTGFDFFPELADSIENEIESICVTEEWK